MKLVTASGKTVLQLSKADWIKIGAKSGWLKEAAHLQPETVLPAEILVYAEGAGMRKMFLQVNVAGTTYVRELPEEFYDLPGKIERATKLKQRPAKPEDYEESTLVMGQPATP